MEFCLQVMESSVAEMPNSIASFFSGFCHTSACYKRLGREAAQMLSISALAVRGDAKEIRRQHKELIRE